MHTFEDNIKTELSEGTVKGVFLCEHGNDLLRSIKVANFLLAL
jgi:hypothetical protein